MPLPWLLVCKAAVLGWVQLPKGSRSLHTTALPFARGACVSWTPAGAGPWRSEESIAHSSMCAFRDVIPEYKVEPAFRSSG